MPNSKYHRRDLEEEESVALENESEEEGDEKDIDVDKIVNRFSNRVKTQNKSIFLSDDTPIDNETWAEIKNDAM